MDIGNHGLFNNVITDSLQTDNALTAPFLDLIGLGIDTLDITRIGQSYCHFFVRDQVGFGDLADFMDINFGAAVIAVNFFNPNEFFFITALILAGLFKIPDSSSILAISSLSSLSIFPAQVWRVPPAWFPISRLPEYHQV